MEPINKQLKRCMMQRCIGYQNNNGAISTVYECICEWTDETRSRAYLVQGPPRWDKASGLFDYEGIAIACYTERPRIDLLTMVKRPS